MIDMLNNWLGSFLGGQDGMAYCRAFLFSFDLEFDRPGHVWICLL